tara:strand:+ start:193 stop:549 length:357 start_codon:yes stop_codon:yes gene_type:complete
MAKEKTKEKEIQVKQRKEKIHEKHLTKLQNIVNTINSLQFNIGKMEVNKFNAMRDLGKSQTDIADMQDLLLKEYGTYDVNVNDGTINWTVPPPKHNSNSTTESNGVEKTEEKSKEDEK